MKNLIVKLVLIFTLALMLLGLFTGCNSLKVDRKRVSKVAFRHPGVLTEYCASKFVGKDSIHVETRYLPGRVDTLPGEVIVIDCDSVKKDSTKPRIVKVPCPPSTHTVDTLYRDSVIVKTDPAAVAKIQMLSDSTAFYKAKASTYKEQLNDATASSRRWKYRLLAVFGLIVLFILIKIFPKWQIPFLQKP